MLAFKLALKNLTGAGLRTWLTVFVLSFSFVLIILQTGFLEGWNLQAKTDTTEWEAGGGQYWHNLYDPFDPFSLTDGHDKIPGELEKMCREGMATPILVSQASVYPEGRMRNILIKGIDPSQNIVKIPSSKLTGDTTALNALIGTRMAKATKLNEGDIVTIRWRDAYGTFDASEIRIAGIFHTSVQTVDLNQIWMPLENLQKMKRLENHATYIVLKQGIDSFPTVPGWIHKGYDILFKDIDAVIQAKYVGVSFFYIILLALALLAVFDTQVLSIFRREKEIGTYIAMGMTRWQVVKLFTIEGAMHSILAVIAGALWGTPLLMLIAKKGFSMPQGTEGYGLTIAEKIYPVYAISTILIMMIVVMVTTTIVSYIPSRKIAGMKPTEALRGKVQ